jgi:hypothetical protein
VKYGLNAPYFERGKSDFSRQDVRAFGWKKKKEFKTGLSGRLEVIDLLLGLMPQQETNGRWVRSIGR